MSEYQHYEFQAVDQPLTEEEMDELRTFSTRAEITPDRFINEYSWGNFKGDENLWMEKYFDGFLYYANWGTYVLKLRLPAALLDIETVQLYCHNDYFSAWLSGDKIILDFLSESEDYEEWEEDLHLSSFLPLRADLSHGDLRCLYLGWLSGLQHNEYDQKQLEPPVPPGLQSLSPALVRFANFLRIDPDLIQAAATTSSELKNSIPAPKDLRAWLSTLPSTEKDEMLTSILEDGIGGGQTAVTLQANRFLQTWYLPKEDQARKSEQRTVSQLLKEAKATRARRLQTEAEAAAAALAERERRQRIAREKQLDEIMGRESILWDQIEALVAEKKAKSYDKAIELLIDLRDLAVREKSTKFSLLLDRLKQRHTAKSSFIKRLRKHFV